MPVFCGEETRADSKKPVENAIVVLLLLSIQSIAVPSTPKKDSGYELYVLSQAALTLQPFVEIMSITDVVGLSEIGKRKESRDIPNNVPFAYLKYQV